MSDRHPRVVVFGLGGTVAMTATDNGGVAPALSARDLIAAVPGASDLRAEVQAEDFRKLPGASLAFEDVVALARTIRERLADGVDGVVVTQGTDTIEESAYLIDLLHARAEPVVVTGAMRNPTLAGADGPANVLAAIQVAASPQARHLGCLVVLADQIHAARRVRKAHTTDLTAFGSPCGPLGFVVENQPSIVNRLPERQCLPAGWFEDRGRSPRVGLLTVTMGDDGGLLDLAGDRYDGIVLAALGAGHVPEWLLEPLADHARRIPVVLTSRTGAGPVLSATYGFPGSETTLLEAGLISAGFLGPFKARVLLHTLLGTGCDRATIEAAFAAAGEVVPAARWPWPSSPGH